MGEVERFIDLLDSRYRKKVEEALEMFYNTRKVSAPWKCDDPEEMEEETY